jgi:hypothetical protein
VFHLAAYTKTNLGNVADTDIGALTDDILTIQNTHFVLQQPMQLVGAAVMSATLSRAKLASPSMRQVASPFVRPIIGAVKPASNPNMWCLDYNPFTIPPFEEIQILATSGVAMTEVFTALVWLAPYIEALPDGNVVPLRFTSTVAATANAWSSVSITFADTLPSGIYAMVLSECQSAQAIAHRWIISNQIPRPGFFSFTNLSDRLPDLIAKGQFGKMGTFRSNDLPRLQVLCNGADAAHEGYLHVVRVGNLAT